MKTQIENFNLSGKLIDEGVTFPNSGNDNLLHNHFKVTVKTGNKSVSFNFYGSNHDYENRIIELSEDELKSAFDCFISDCVCGLNFFTEFCNELGYDEDSRNAEKIYKACQKSLTKLQRIYSGDIYDLANSINEKVNS